MNVINLIGRFTRDPETNTANSGAVFTRFTLAVDNPFKKGEADFINCVAFNKTAELIGEHLTKGRQLGVSGRLQMNRYEVDGENRTSYDVVVNNITFISNKESSGGTKTTTNTSNATGRATEVKEEEEEAFPF